MLLPKFVQQCQCKQDFADHYETFWCNCRQSKDERVVYKRNGQLLFKIKCVGLQVTNISSDSVMVSKKKKQVFFVDGNGLKESAEMKVRTDIN